MTQNSFKLTTVWKCIDKEMSNLQFHACLRRITYLKHTWPVFCYLFVHTWGKQNYPPQHLTLTFFKLVDKGFDNCRIANILLTQK